MTDVRNPAIGSQRRRSYAPTIPSANQSLVARCHGSGSPPGDDGRANTLSMRLKEGKA